MNMPGGRPSIYSQELAEIICERMVLGESIRDICLSDDMPHLATVMRWRMKSPEFCEQYEKAQKMRAELHVEDMLGVAKDAQVDIKRARLITDIMKWNASKMVPRFADKVAIGGSADMPPVQVQTTNVLDVSGMTVEQLEALQAALVNTMQNKETES